MARSTFLFDLDGTIWDSHSWYSAILHPDDQIAQKQTIASLRGGSSIITLADRCGISKATLLMRCSDCAQPPPLYPHVFETISSLDERHARLGVVTSLSGQLATLMLARVGLTRYFDAIVHPGNCSTRKPSPGPLLQALAVLGNTSQHAAVYVGDSSTDYLSASRAGIPFVWAGYGYGERPGQNCVEIRDIAEVLQL